MERTNFFTRPKMSGKIYSSVLAKRHGRCTDSACLGNEIEWNEKSGKIGEMAFHSCAYGLREIK